MAFNRIRDALYRSDVLRTLLGGRGFFGCLCWGRGGDWGSRKSPGAQWVCGGSKVLPGVVGGVGFLLSELYLFSGKIV